MTHGEAICGLRDSPVMGWLVPVEVGSGSASEVSGASLVERIAAGDRQAESEFANCYRRGIHALVRRHCRPLDPAVDDLSQEVVIAVLEKLRSGALRDPAALPAYVRSTVVLMVQAEYRRRARRGEQGADDHQPPMSAPQGTGAPAVDPPALAAERLQVAGCVQRLLGGLDRERDRELLRRFYLLGQDRDAICAALDIEAGHFRRVLFRARERFAALAREQGLEQAG